MARFSLSDVAFEYARRVANALEAVCEESLQTGQYGVRIVFKSDMSFTASVCEEVPYGCIEEVWEDES